MLFYIKMQCYKPTLIILGKPLPLNTISWFALKQFLFFRGIEKFTLKGRLYYDSNSATCFEFSLVNRDCLNHRIHLIRFIVNLYQRSDGLIIGPVTKEYLWYPNWNILLLCFQLNVFLQILKTILHQRVTPALGFFGGFDTLLSLAGLTKMNWPHYGLNVMLSSSLCLLT